MSYAILRNSVDQSVSNSTDTAITWNTEDVDVGGLHSGSGATVTLGIGVWLLIAIVSWQPNSTGSRQIKIRQGGIVDIAFMERSIVGSAVSERMVLPIIWSVTTTGTTFEVLGRQTSGGSLNVLGVRSSYFMVYSLIEI